MAKNAANEKEIWIWIWIWVGFIFAKNLKNYETGSSI
jgi:hypothetical protein